jgi:hypothetical protein
MRKLLMTEPKFNNALLVEVVSIENFPDIKNKYGKNPLPVSTLYDVEGNEVWRIEGKYDLDNVRRKLEEFIESSEKYIDSSLEISQKIS